MNKAVLVRAGAAVAGAALLTAALTACGGNEGGSGGGKAADEPGKAAAAKPSEAIKASYLKTVDAKFATIDLTSAEADGKSSRQVGVKGWYPSSQDLTMTADGEDKRLLQIGDDVYAPADKAATGKPWMRIGLSDGGKPGVFLNQDPAEYLAMLLDQDELRHVGAEKSGAVATEHYRGTFTLAELLRADSRSKVMEDDRRTALQAALRKAQIKTYEVDIWIGGDGYPVRLEDALTDDKGTTKTKASFSDFGKAPAVKAPPADQVSDFDDVIGSGGS